MKKCQYCAEDIQDDAILCRHCGRELVSRAHGARVSPGATALAVISIICGAIGLVILALPMGIVALLCGIPAVAMGSKAGIVGIVFGILEIAIGIGLIALLSR